MTAKKKTDWAKANQRYLMAAVKAVQEELGLYISKQDSRYNGKKPETPDSSYAADELNKAAQEMPSPAAVEILEIVFNLSTFERKILLTCAGVELDSGFASLIASLQTGSKSFVPTFSIAFAAFSEAHWSALSPDAPLRYWRLIEVNPGCLLTQSPLRIDEGVLHYLTGIYQLDERLEGILEPCFSEHDLVPSHKEKADQVTAIISQNPSIEVSPVIELNGDDFTDNISIAADVCARLGSSLYSMSSFAIPGNVKEASELSRLWNREAVLGSFALLIDCSETDLVDTSRLQTITGFCERIRGLLFIYTRRWKPKLHRPSVDINVNKPTSKEQRFLWEKRFGHEAVIINGEVDKLVAQFNLSARAISRISSKFLSELALKEKNSDETSGILLWKTCCAYTRPGLEVLAQRIEPVAGWDDLILPEPHISALREIVMHVKQRARVYEDWGFGKKSMRGLGISTLFSGESGTGKTMASEVLAKELKLDLYRIDLSQVVNKYIGETEKNLKKIFDAAEDGGAILLFDEADALFGKRSEVKDSHDRYANIEVSYLLQRMEAYRGLAILTTNMKTAIDKAFLRRIRFVIHFPFPDTKQRAEIWHHIFPADTPQGKLDWEKLARMNLSGGNIRNIALSASFIAADEGVPVSMTHISVAARSEYAKLEKPMSIGEMI